MKQSIKLLLGGALLLSLPMFLTSCEDILGEWDKPAPVNVTPDDGGTTSGTIAYVKYTVSGTTATPSDQQLAEGTYTVVTADLAELTADKPYVVNDDITIGHDVTISDDAEIVICDGKTLTINGKLSVVDQTDPTKNLKLYGQTGKTGTLKVTNAETTAAVKAICVKGLEVHGACINSTSQSSSSGQAIHVHGDFNLYDGTITATANGDDTQSLEVIAMGGTAKFNMYNGTVTTTGNMQGLMVDHLYLYGGELNANGGTQSGGAGAQAVSGEVNVSGGTLTAIGGDAKSGSTQDGGDGIASSVNIDGGKIIATGGAADGGATDGLGISNWATITTGGTISFYEGNSPNPTTPGTLPNASKRYVVLQ